MVLVGGAGVEIARRSRRSGSSTRSRKLASAAQCRGRAGARRDRRGRGAAAAGRTAGLAGAGAAPAGGPAPRRAFRRSGRLPGRLRAPARAGGSGGARVGGRRQVGGLRPRGTARSADAAPRPLSSGGGVIGPSSGPPAPMRPLPRRLSWPCARGLLLGAGESKPRGPGRCRPAATGGVPNADATLPAAARRRPAAVPLQRLRVLFALMLRDMGTRFGRSAGGYLWAVAEPLGGILLLALAFSLCSARRRSARASSSSTPPASSPSPSTARSSTAVAGAVVDQPRAARATRW